MGEAKIKIEGYKSFLTLSGSYAPDSDHSLKIWKWKLVNWRLFSVHLLAAAVPHMSVGQVTFYWPFIRIRELQELKSMSIIHQIRFKSGMLYRTDNNNNNLFFQLVVQYFSANGFLWWNISHISGGIVGLRVRSTVVTGNSGQVAACWRHLSKKGVRCPLSKMNGRPAGIFLMVSSCIPNLSKRVQTFRC